MTPRCAYRLCDAPGADSFVRAWDQAMSIGIDRCAAQPRRALEGGFVPVYRRGKLVRVEHRRNDKLAIALLGGQRASSDDLRRSALSRREHRLDLFALDAARAEHKRQLAEAEAAFRAESTASSGPSSRAALTAPRASARSPAPARGNPTKW